MRGDVTQNRLRGEHLCVGCGICALVCPTRALAMVYSKRGQHEPRLDAARCTRCGTCLHYCPVELRKLRESTEANLEGADPLMAGLEGSSCYVAHDPDPLHRLHSASGGAITAILVRLLEQGELDAVIHAERLSAPVGGSHFAACVSRTAEACGQRRGSLYGPLCYQEALEGFRGSTARLAITGVPCVLAGMRRLFAEHPDFCRARPLLAGLVCSHNVSGLFVDFLARSMGLPATQPFEADLRDKAGIPDANNFNTCFRSGGRVLARENRFRNLFTTLWRSHAFALEACHYCPDFWGKAADLCVKDAWGKWAEDPLGKSIVAVRHPGIRSLLEEGTLLSVEALPLDQAALCQKETSTYKLLAVTHRLEKCWCSRLNRESGFAFHFATARLSRVLFRRLGYRLSRTLLLAFLPPDGIRRSRAPGAASSGSESLRERLLANLPPAPRTLALFGAGAMAGDLLAALPDRIAFLVDNDAGKQGRRLGGKPIQAPRDLAERQDRPYILIGVAKDSAIASQLEGYGFREGRDFLRCAPLHEATTKANRQAGGHKPRRKILVLGGYGYRNTGDEAQLNANLKDLARLFPDHLVQVLSPDPAYTHFHHERCSVSEAPRKAFYDTDTSGLYALQSPLDKARFLSRSLWLYLNAFLVSRGLPPFLLKAKRCALLHELESASLVFFSGGGYLTGSTLSRLWDGLFFMAFARVLKVPVVLSGQTLGVWNSRFTRWLAGWGLRKAALITVRDAGESLKALAELGLRRDLYFSTCDDALFCAKSQDPDAIQSLLQRAGLPEGAGYVALNVHYWGLEAIPERERLLEQLDKICVWVRQETGLELLGIPMVPSDQTTLADLAERSPDLGLRRLDYDYDFRTVRAVIARAQICITMKHHPIIFAMGEGVPALSLARGAYYHHKNLGALKLFGMGFCHVGLEHEQCFEQFQGIFRRIQEDRASLVEQIRSARQELEARRERFLAGVRALSPGD